MWNFKPKPRSFRSHVLLKRQFEYATLLGQNHELMLFRRKIMLRGIAPPTDARRVAKKSASFESNAQAIARAPQNAVKEIAVSTRFDIRTLILFEHPCSLLPDGPSSADRTRRE